MRILFTGGGTGGHFFPIIAVTREIKRIAEEERILEKDLYYMGPDDFGADLLRQEEIKSIKVLSGKIRRYFSLYNISDFIKLAIGTAQAFWKFFLTMPDVVFSKGGYGAVPAVIMCAVFRIPLIIHESDSVPGRVNLFSARIARRVAVAFPSAAEFFPKKKTALIGIPIRKGLLGGIRETARQNLGVTSNLPAIGFIGASQGSQAINNALLGVLRELAENFEILHQTGAKNFTEVRGEGEVSLESGHKERYHAFGFLSESQMRDFYAASDLVVSRAGASSIFEIAASGKPSILVPLEGAAQDHQRKNAYDYAETGAALVIEDSNLTPHVLLGEIKKIMSNPALLQKMAPLAQKFARIDSAEVIAREILNMGIH